MAHEANGIPTGPDNGLRRSRRWTAARRDTYLAVLGQTGNARAAAEAIGMDRATLEHRRGRDPAFAADCRIALATAQARLGEGPPGDPDPFETVRRGPQGKPQIVATGKGRWNGRIEARFLALLRASGNVSASARAVGFTPETVWQRRRKWPGFARAMEAVLEEAVIELEFRLVKHGSDAIAAAGDGGEETHGLPAGAGFDREFALKFLKWREEKRAGGGRRGRGDRNGPKPPTFEEARDNILRKIDAIERQRAREKKGDGEGELPPA